MRRCLALSIPLLVLLLLLLPTAAVAAPDATGRFDRAIDRLIDKGYPQGLEEYFVSLGTNPDLGFRWAGTSAERAVSMRVKHALQACGLHNVRLERVPVDVFEFKHASVKVGDRVMTASTFAGVPPTSRHGIKGEVVYVGSGSAAEFDAVGDVSGKLVLCDLAMNLWWFNWPGAEAAWRGAAGVIMTYGTDDSYYSYSPDALGSFDATYQFDWAPMVYISKADGDWLKAQLAAAGEAKTAVKARMVYKARVTLADEGGYGYNVIATLRGRCRDGQKIVFAAHQDAHFRAGMDDTSALVNMLTIAKAMRISGYRPYHDVVFLATCGEEFGYTDCYYDWLTGAWWAATHSHRDWAGKVRAVLNLELMGLKDAPLHGPCSEELQGWLTALATEHASLLPYGGSWEAPVYCWNDQWPFSAEGIPSVEFATSNEFYDTVYHTNFETIELVDYGYLGQIAKFLFRAQSSLDKGLLPYDLPARAATLSASVNGDDLKAAGADPAIVDRLVADVAAFSAAADAYAAGAGSIDDVWAANRKLLRIEKIINDKFIALDCWDFTVYPHEQILGDVQAINASLEALATAPSPAASDPLWDVGQMWNGLNFSHDAFVDDQRRHDPDYDRIAWGGQGQLSPYLDLVDEYNQIQTGDYAAAAASLTEVRDSELCLLDRRLAKMARVLEWVTPQVEGITP
jgi:hypothetical protein